MSSRRHLKGIGIFISLRALKGKKKEKGEKLTGLEPLATTSVTDGNCRLVFFQKAHVIFLEIKTKNHMVWVFDGLVRCRIFFLGELDPGPVMVDVKFG